MASPRRTAVLLLAALASCAAPACTTPRRPNLLVVTIDTLRADRLGCYGATSGLTPRLDALAASGTLFDQLIVPVPRTTQSTASLLTGRHPIRHGARGLFWALPASGGRTLAEELAAADYETAALVGNLFLRPGQGFERGFALYDNPPSRWEKNGASRTVDDALDWLDRPRKGPWFLWVHLLDPHWSYEPSPPYDARAGGVTDADRALYQGMASGAVPKGQGVFGTLIPEEQAHRLVRLYEGEIAAVDAAVGRLLDGLRARGAAGQTIVLVTADHGESLGEHGYRFAHGETLYDDTLRVPAILSGPGIPAGRRLHRLVRNFDLMPTLLVLAGRTPPEGIDGISRARDVVSGEENDRGREIYVESDLQFLLSGNPKRFLPGYAGSWRGLRTEALQLIRIPRPGSDLWEIYDLASDPAETRNLAGSPPPAVEAARKRLAEWEERAALPAGAEAGPPAAGGTAPLESLRSLGYVDTGPARGGAAPEGAR